MPCMCPALSRLILGLFLMSLARLAYFNVFDASSRYVSAVVTHATMSVLLLPPNESCHKNRTNLHFWSILHVMGSIFAYFRVFNDSSRYVSAVVTHATISVLLLPPSESCQQNKGQVFVVWSVLHVMGVLCILQGVQRFLLLSLVTHAITSVLLLLPRKTESWCSVQTISKIECFLWYNTFWVMSLQTLMQPHDCKKSSPRIACNFEVPLLSATAMH